MRTYVLSDIHGCLNAFNKAIRWAFIDSLRDETPDSQIILLGDYVDRGPDSRGVIARIRELQRNHDVIVLAGNHEQMMYQGILGGNVDMLNCWLGNGGNQTLQSYGASALSVQWPDQMIHDCVWMAQLLTGYEDQYRYYVHAGLQPGVPWAEQTVEMRLWYRKPKDEPEFWHGKQVIHGHTPQKGRKPFVDPCRINIDTGVCFPKGCLTMACFIDDNPTPHFEQFTETPS